MNHSILIKASSRYPIRRKRIKSCVVQTLEAMQVFDRCEVEIEGIGDRKMRQMKREHLGIDETTDVLSFPLQEVVGKKSLNPYAVQRSTFSFDIKGDKKESIDGNVFPTDPDGVVRLGNILISDPQAQRQANVHHLGIDDEIDQLVEHGMLHLLGVHHD